MRPPPTGPPRLGFSQGCARGSLAPRAVWSVCTLGSFPPKPVSLGGTGAGPLLLSVVPQVSLNYWPKFAPVYSHLSQNFGTWRLRRGRAACRHKPLHTQLRDPAPPPPPPCPMGPGEPGSHSCTGEGVSMSLGPGTGVLLPKCTVLSLPVTLKQAGERSGAQRGAWSPGWLVVRPWASSNHSLP